MWTSPDILWVHFQCHTVYIAFYNKWRDLLITENAKRVGVNMEQANWHSILFCRFHFFRLFKCMFRTVDSWLLINEVTISWRLTFMLFTSSLQLWYLQHLLMDNPSHYFYSFYLDDVIVGILAFLAFQSRNGEGFQFDIIQFFYFCSAIISKQLDQIEWIIFEKKKNDFLFVSFYFCCKPTAYCRL